MHACGAGLMASTTLLFQICCMAAYCTMPGSSAGTCSLRTASSVCVRILCMLGKCIVYVNYPLCVLLYFDAVCFGGWSRWTDSAQTVRNAIPRTNSDNTCTSK